MGSRGLVIAVLGTTAIGCSGQVVTDRAHPADELDAATHSDARGRGTGGATNADARANWGCPDLPAVDPPSAPVSFRNDIMPIFALSCIASSCHDAAAKKADLVLGDFSACSSPGGATCFDPNAKWKYTFPRPVPDALVAQVLANLLNVPSKIVPSVLRVAPGDPEHSFLLDTVKGTENSMPYSGQCTNTNPEVTSQPCGTDMPLGVPGGFCGDGDPLSVRRVEAIARWIQQGVQNN